MKTRRCPYCGKRIPYHISFFSKNKGEYVCSRCEKESKIIVDKKIYLCFCVLAIISLAIMAGWIFAGLLSNPFGIILVAIPLVAFFIASPSFVSYKSLNKYKKSMEAKKAGIAYSDNLLANEINEADKKFEIEDKKEITGEFHLNNDIFNKIKDERTAARELLKNGEIISDSAKIEKQQTNYVPIIKNVSEGHISTNAPLKKINTENRVNRQSHYIHSNADNREKTEEKNNYSANRKF